MPRTRLTPADIQQRRDRFADAYPLHQARMLSDAHALAVKWNRTMTCKRCHRALTYAQWPMDTTGHQAAHCGICVSPLAKLSIAERQRRKKARKQRWLDAVAAKQGRVHRTLGEICRDRELRQMIRPLKDQLVASRRSLNELHDAHCRLFFSDEAREYRWRYRYNQAFNLNERLRRQLRKKAEAVPGLAEIIRGALKRGSRNDSIEGLLGYSMPQLKDHIERQFTRGMSWDKWGKGGIHIDHILPRKCFDLTTVEGVQAYWALHNLRPLWAKDNLRKRDKVQVLL